MLPELWLSLSGGLTTTERPGVELFEATVSVCAAAATGITALASIVAPSLKPIVSLNSFPGRNNPLGNGAPAAQSDATMRKVSPPPAEKNTRSSSKFIGPKARSRAAPKVQNGVPASVSQTP